jgi:hypothetical protein
MDSRNFKRKPGIRALNMQATHLSILSFMELTLQKQNQMSPLREQGSKLSKRML